MSHTIKQLNVDETINEWLQSKKYRKIDLTEETMRDVLIRELSCQPDAGRAAPIARRKLHHIAAAYLGDPDYEVAEQQIADAIASDDALAILDVCRAIAGQHATARERLRFIGSYYRKLFAVTGLPNRILDLACGLNPLFVPWMGLPAGAEYHAYDIRTGRVKFLNSFFRLLETYGERQSGCEYHTSTNRLNSVEERGRPGGFFRHESRLQLLSFRGVAHVQDVLVRPPRQEADLVLLLQEVHRIEQRKPGATRELLERLDAPCVVISLPSRSLCQKHDLRSSHRCLFERVIRNSSWNVHDFELGNELIFCIRR